MARAASTVPVQPTPPAQATVYRTTWLIEATADVVIDAHDIHRTATGLSAFHRPEVTALFVAR